jgi:lipopolysaccharide export system permease protein
LRLLDKHILKELTPTFVGTVVLFAGFILIAGGPLLRAVSYLADGIPLWIVLQLIGLYLPPMVVLAFPMGMLIAVILGFTRFSSDSEAVAMYASGISFYRMLAPTALFGLLAAGLGLVINNSVVPEANHRITYLKSRVIHDVQQTSEPFTLPPIYDNHGNIQALTWVGGGYDDLHQSIRNVTIIEYDPTGGWPVATIFAKSAQWLGGSDWRLHEVRILREGILMTAPALVTKDIKSSPETVAFMQESPDDLTFSQLAHQIAILKHAGIAGSKEMLDAQVSLWNKIALPLATFVFALVGAPLALRPQRAASRQAGFGYGILIILGYYALEKYLEILATGGRVDPALAAFVPNLVGAALAGWLISRATT